MPLPADGAITITVISPVYNNGSGIAALLAQVQSVLAALKVVPQIILVDDGSTDDSWKQILSCGSTVDGLQAYRHHRNLGQHQAIYTGLQYATGDWVVVMDADLQDNPAYIAAFFERCSATKRSVLANRLTKKNHPYYVISSYVLNACLSVLVGIRMHYRTGNFGMFMKSTIAKVRTLPPENFYFPVAVRLAEGRIAHMDVEFRLRYDGSSSYTFGKHLRLAFQALLYAAAKRGKQIDFNAKHRIQEQFINVGDT